MKKTNCPKMENGDRDGVLDYAARCCGTRADYPWRTLPGYAVLRHTDSRKWYGLIMNVPAEKLGMHGKGTVDILEIKCDSILSGSLLHEKGIRPAYHMKQGGWPSGLLDGSVEQKLLFSLLDMSHVMRLKKLEQFEPSFLPLEKLKSYGIGAVRGPRRMPHSLICDLERSRHEQ